MARRTNRPPDRRASGGLPLPLRVALMARRRRPGHAGDAAPWAAAGAPALAAAAGSGSGLLATRGPGAPALAAVAAAGAGALAGAEPATLTKAWADLDGLGAGVASFGGSGTNQYYLTAGPVIPTDKSSYTVHVLFRATAVGANMSLFDQRPLDGGTTLTAGRLMVLANGGVRAVIRDGTNAAIVADTAAGSVSAGAWTLATLVRSGASVSAYRNAGAKATASGTMIATPGGVNAIGGFRSAWPAADLMHGEIMFVDVLDGAQSDAEVAAYHAALGTLGTQFPGADAGRINRLDLTGPVVRGAVDDSVIARAFRVPAFAALGTDAPAELHDPYPGLPILSFGGWTFPPATAPTYQDTPARLVGGGVMSGSKAGAVLLAAGAGSAAVGLQLSPAPPAATEQLYAEVLPDGSGVTVARTSGDFVAVRLLAAGGSTAATLTSSDTLFGRAEVAAAVALDLPAAYWSNTRTEPVTRIELTLADPADCLKFAEGHKVVLEGDANYPGEYAVSEVDPAGGWIRFVVDGTGSPAPGDSGVFVRGVGETEHTPSSGDAPRYAGLRVAVEGDSVEVHSLGRLIGSGTLAGLSSLGGVGATRYLGTHPGSPDAAPSSAVAGVVEVAGPDAAALAEMDARLAVLAARRDGWARDHATLWVGDMPGTWHPSYIEEERETAILEPDGATLIGGGWAHAVTGQGYGRSNGVAVVRDVGEEDLAEEATYPVRHALFRRPFGYSDEALEPELLYAGPVAELRRRPLDWKWRTLHVDPTLGSDSNAGTEGAPFATMGPVMRRMGPYTRVLMKRGETHGSMGGLTATSYPDWADVGGGVQGPFRWEVYGDEGDGRATLGYSRAFDVDAARAFRLGPGFLLTGPADFGNISDCALVDFECSHAGNHTNLKRCRGVLIDRYRSDPATPTQYQLYSDGVNSWLFGVLRADFAAGVSTTNYHSFRTQGTVGFEMALGEPVASLDGDNSFRQINIRHGMKGSVVADVVDAERKIYATADANENAVHCNVRWESCATADVTAMPCSAAVVAHFLHAGTGGDPNASTFSGGNHRVGPRRMRALGTRTRVGNSSAWSRFTHEPAAGPFANADQSSGDFGAISMPGVALAEARPDGSVALLADGYPLGGGAALVALRWRRRAAAGGAWTAVPGSGRRVMTDPAPGAGSWVYSTYTGSDPDAPDASGAESDPVAVA